MAKKKKRPFKEARAFAQGLKLKNQTEWRDYCRSGKKPEDIPSNPDYAYAEFQGYGDWLGTGNVAKRNRQWRPFEKAREFARNLKLKNRGEWQDFCKSGKRPDDIPSKPHEAYPEFKNYSDWLGIGKMPKRNKQWRPFQEAREFARRLKLKNVAEWKAFCKSGEKPEDIPSNPNREYAEFQGYGDWLGTGVVNFRHRQCRPFEEAREFARSLKLKNQAEWWNFCDSGQKPEDIPVRPDVAYASEFQGYGDWLGTGNVSNQDKQWRPFEKAREFARSLKLRNQREWQDFCNSDKRPDDIPVHPERIYKSEFRGYGDWLGNVSRWNKTALLALLSDLRLQMTSVLDKEDLLAIIQQGGTVPSALPALRSAFGREDSLTQVLRDLKDNRGRGLEQAIRSISDDEIVARHEHESTDQKVPDNAHFLTLFEDHIFESKDVAATNQHTSSSSTAIEDALITDVDESLPTLATPDSLRAIDSWIALSRGLDDETAEFLVTKRVSALWQRYMSEEREVVDELLASEGGYWFTEIKTRFLSEVEGVENLTVPEGWAFTVDGNLAPPLPMQRRAAWAVREKRRVGNWSGVGTGKTLSAVLASRVVDAHRTLVVTNNATVEQWKDQIEQTYPDSVVHTYADDRLKLDPERFNYVVLNYEKFQTSNRNHLVHLLVNLGMDFVVLDEVQFVKKRDNNETNRRKALEALVCALEQTNPSLRVLGMSATPVINNLFEAKKLLEIITGMEFPELRTHPTVNNALAIRRALMIYGFRHHPSPEQDMREKPKPTTRNDLFERLRRVGSDVLSVEQLLLPAKIERVKNYFRKGTIIYTHYVDGMVDRIRTYLKSMDFKVGMYTGSDKSGLDPFKKGDIDILIGSQPVGTGLDGLQSVCNRLIMLSLPWTRAEYEQIVGRIRRQGSAFGEVEIIIPQVMLDYEGDTWSWDKGRMALIHYKQTLSDCAVDGDIPETVRINQNALLKQSREALDRWIERIGEEGLLTIERERLTVPLPPDLRHVAQVRHGDFTVLNNRWSTSRSDTTHARLQNDPSEWHLYHTLYREARKNWPEQPFERIAERIQVRPDWVVGDFGCGECLLGKALPDNQVIGLDHIKWNDSVVQCDMSFIPRNLDCSLDAAVFSLSLMGVNWRDYLKEAYRGMKPYGHLFIAEPKKKWEDRTKELKDAVEATGFQIVGDVEQRYDFLYLTGLKT